MSASRESIAQKIQLLMESLSAMNVADLFLSPFVHPQLLNGATSEPGPSLWIVNRSDVSDETLAALGEHPLADIAARAKEKLRLRRSNLKPLTPPVIEGPLESIEDTGVEDVLGHPLAPFEAMIFFARSLNEDHRASAALSLTRRYLEYPPPWLTGDPEQFRLVDVFGKMLLDDSSAYVRSFCARIPFLPASVLQQALERETNAFVLGRLLQNAKSTAENLHGVVGRGLTQSDPFVSRVAALDQRLSDDARKQLAPQSDELTRAIHDWYLERALT
ncbi:MAG: hypothetical protein JST16_09400 [Bdellovibrionales bacterium]|nr:hypothetical protein [Bdellovibrionales bacterium]